MAVIKSNDERKAFQIQSLIPGIHGEPFCQYGNEENSVKRIASNKGIKNPNIPSLNLIVARLVAGFYIFETFFGIVDHRVIDRFDTS
jgi:hypothetical protein